MIKVTVGNNTSRENVIVPITATPRQVLEENGIDYSRGQMTIDGCPMRPGDFDKTFGDLGIKEDGKCFLLSVVKADNA